MNAVANDQVWHRRLRHFQPQSLDILRKRNSIGITLEGAVSDCDVCTMEKCNTLLTPKQPTTRSAGLSSCATGT